MSNINMNGILPPLPRGEGASFPPNGSSNGSSYTVLTNNTGSTNSNGFILPSPAWFNGQSMTDVTLEQALEKVQELLKDNNNLRESLKESSATAKKQFQTMLQWREKVRESNKANLKKFEELNRINSLLRAENEKYKELCSSPDKQGSLFEELQTRVRTLEEEKVACRREADELQLKVDDLRAKIVNLSPDTETVFVNSMDSSEIDAYKNRCVELASQVQNFHQQNEQLMQDLQQVTKLKQLIQEENSKLTTDNIELQKKLQSFLGDMNKAKHYIGGTVAEAPKEYNYSMKVESSGDGETVSSVTAEQDLEILMKHTSVTAERNTEEQIMSGMAEELKEKLQMEKEASSQQKQKISTQESFISKLRSQLKEKDQMLSHYKQQFDSQMTHVTQQHEMQKQDLLRQLDGLNTELQQTKHSMEYSGDVQNLKSQVISLIKEVQETSGKLDATMKALDKKSAKVMELEQHIRQLNTHMQQSRSEADSLIQSLRYSLTSCEETLGRERDEHGTTKKQMIDLRSSFNRLVNDYKELLDTFDEYKATQHQHQTGSQNKQLMDEINRLTAQTIAAEEAIQYRDEQIVKLKSDNAHLKEEVDNTIPVLRAQADLWKQDFDAERGARERQVAEKESLLQEMKNLQLKNEQLIDEVENYSRRSLAEMQRRHAAPSYQQQMQNFLQHPGSPYQSGSPQQHSPTGYQQQSPNAYPQQNPGGFSPNRAGYQPQPVEHGSGDEMQGQGRQRPRQPPSQGSNDERDDPLTCPKCGLSCPDFDTLQIHVIDCIDS